MIRREVIGPPDCPILHRWTLVGRSKGAPVKLLLHHFLPSADDRDVHDHPRPFWTLVLRGYYDDMVPWGAGLAFGERMRAGTLRRRSASHAHRTRVGPKGCWTLVLMGPLRREWGFWREGRWFSNAAYFERYGYGMGCGDPVDATAEPVAPSYYRVEGYRRRFVTRETAEALARALGGDHEVLAYDESGKVIG